MSRRRTKTYIIISSVSLLLATCFLLSLVPVYKNSQQSKIHCEDRKDKIGNCSQVMVRSKLLTFGAQKKYVAIIAPNTKSTNPASSVKDGEDLLSSSPRYFEVGISKECVVSYQSSYWDEYGLHILTSSGQTCLINRQQIGEW